MLARFKLAGRCRLGGLWLSCSAYVFSPRDPVRRTQAIGRPRLSADCSAYCPTVHFALTSCSPASLRPEAAQLPQEDANLVRMVTHLLQVPRTWRRQRGDESRCFRRFTQRDDAAVAGRVQRREALQHMREGQTEVVVARGERPLISLASHCRVWTARAQGTGAEGTFVACRQSRRREPRTASDVGVSGKVRPSRAGRSAGLAVTAAFERWQ